MYLDALAQEEYDKDLSDAIGWNCIQRRNFGLLIAHDMKADVVAVVDDDNIPLADWGENLMVGKEVEVNFYSRKTKRRAVVDVTFGTENPISTLYAVWSMPQNAILIPMCSPSLPTGLRYSTHRTLSSQAP
ncbi:MAG: hypothetical protein WBE50_04860 [Methyloceanibacter sp.]